MVGEVATHGVDGASVLGVGGGVGAIEIELLRAGAREAVVVELSEAYDEEARALLAETGVARCVERRHGDFVEAQALIDPADVVVMHRVVCCYPDVDALVGAAARHTRRLLAMSFPRETWWTKLGSRIVNLWSKAVWGFESFVHPHAKIAATARAEGLRPVHEETGRLWHVAVLERV
jgi:2-polyprenyl-3-methyl-5-hydroxy-6-metoxy-1,4-benzoquinol methylase